jgi:hypothetical protein
MVRPRGSYHRPALCGDRDGVYGRRGKQAQGARPLRAIVQLLSQTAGGFPREMPTDAEGKYSFAGLPAGNYRVVAIDPIARLNSARTR